MTTEDRRAHPRFPVPRIPGVLAFSLRADVVDLSLAGMSVECPVPLTAGKRFAVRIGKGTDQMDLVATVRWCERVPDSEITDERDRYRAGLAFHDILTDKAESLLTFMERNVVVALDRQLFGRLELEGDTPAELEGDFEFLIENLALESAEIETRQPPEKGAVYDLELNLEGTRFSSPGRVADVRMLDRGEVAYAVDIEFENTPSDQIEVLRTFLRQRIS